MTSPARKLDCNCKLAELMRSVVPEPGVDIAGHLLVQLKAGERVGRHEHKEHTVLYYPADSAPIVVTPVAGMVIYLPPGTPHAVPTVEGDRLSVAMLINS